GTVRSFLSPLVQNRDRSRDSASRGNSVQCATIVATEENHTIPAPGAAGNRPPYVTDRLWRAAGNVQLLELPGNSGSSVRGERDKPAIGRPEWWRWKVIACLSTREWPYLNGVQSSKPHPSHTV